MTNSANTPEPKHCTPVRGGRVHRMTATDLPTPFPGCRTGGSDHGGTQYRETSAPLTCSHCVATQAALDAKAAEAAAVEVPAEQDEESTLVTILDGTTEVRADAHDTAAWFITRAGLDLGTVRDEGPWSSTRGRFAAWSQRGATRRDGIVGFYADRDEAARAIAAANPTGAAAAEPAPRWRTLKGVTVPFQLYGEDEPGGRFRPAGDRTQVTGQPITIVRTNMDDTTRCGRLVDSTGRHIHLTAAATQFWITATDGPAGAAPEWRTLKGIAAPFQLYGQDTPKGGFRPAGDRTQVTGEPVTVTRVWMEYGLRCAEDSTGRRINLYGLATKFWVVPGPTAGLTEPQARAYAWLKAGNGWVTKQDGTITRAAFAGLVAAGLAVWTNNSPAWWGGRLVDASPVWPGILTAPTLGDPVTEFAAVIDEAAAADTAEATPAPAAPTAQERPTMTDAMNRYLGREALLPRATCAAEADRPATVTARVEGEPGEDWSAGERYTAEAETVLAHPGYREDRITIRAEGSTSGLSFRLPHSAGHDVNDVLAAVGWHVRGALKHIDFGGHSIRRGRVERATPADTPAAEEMRNYFADAIAAWKVIAAHIEPVSVHAHTWPVVREGDAYPIGWTFRVGYGPGATYAAVTRSGSLDGLTGRATRQDAETALRATCGDPAPAPAMQPYDAYNAVSDIYPSAGYFVPEADEAGECIGYTFEAEIREFSRYGWVTAAGTYSRSLESSRDEAAAMLPAQAADDQRVAGRNAERTASAAATLPLKQAKQTAGRSYPNARAFQACTAPNGELLAYTFQTGNGSRPQYGWVNPDGTLAPVTETYRGTIEDMLLKEAEFKARPSLPRRRKSPEPDAAQLKALRQLLTRVRVISVNGDMEGVRRALAAYDDEMEASR